MLVLLALLFLLTPLRGQTLFIQRATVIDLASSNLASSKPLKNTSVVVSGGRISAIRKKIKVPPGAQVINARGKFLIPGLWDMHMHLGLPEFSSRYWSPTASPACARCSLGFPGAIRAWRTRPDVPRIVAPGFSTARRCSGRPRFRPAPSPSQLPIRPASPSMLWRRAAWISSRSTAASRATRISPWPQEARAIGIPFAGHVPEAVSPAEASDAGQRSEEHLINILVACSTREEELRAQRVAAMHRMTTMSGEARMRLLGFPDAVEALFRTYSEEKAANLFRTFVRNGTWQTPTLALLQGFAYGDETAFEIPIANTRSKPGQTPGTRAIRFS